MKQNEVQAGILARIAARRSHLAHHSSVKSTLYRLFLIFVIVCTLVASVYTVQAVFLLNREINSYNQNTAERYVDSFDRILDNISSVNQRISVNNTHFKKLSQTSCSESERAVAVYNLLELLHEVTYNYCATLVYKSDADLNNVIYYYGSSINDKQAFLDQSRFIHSLEPMLKDHTRYIVDQWFLYEEDGHHYLFLVNRNQSLYLCSILDLDGYLQDNALNSYQAKSELIISSGGSIISVFDPNRMELELSEDDLGHFIINTARSERSGLSFSLVTSKSTLLLRILPGIIIYIAIILALNILLRVVLKIINQSLLFPLQEIANKSAQLSGGELSTIDTDVDQFDEYNEIRAALNGLMEQKQDLEHRYLSIQEQKEHALLQYFQLQTRSHFFINCLKSLYSMAEKNNRTQMQAMIIAFSNHLRYIFHDNLVLVSLSDEMKEVTDYHRIITLDFPKPFLLTTDVPKELMDVSVPTLVVQTFLENTYKYARRDLGMLLFRVEVRECQRGSMSYIRFHISDNGGGYQQDVLDSINTDSSAEFSKYNVGINNLKQRVYLLYGKDCEFRFYNEGDGAHSVIDIPLTRVAKDK